MCFTQSPVPQVKANHRITSQVHLGVGYLELPQIEFTANRPMIQLMLRSQKVYLLDAHTDVFVWVGAHSDR